MTDERNSGRLWSLLRRDGARLYGAAALACAVAALFEFFVTATSAIAAWRAADEAIAGVTLIRLLCLDFALWAVAWPILGTLLALLAIALRLLVRLFAGDRSLTWPGLLATTPTPDRAATRLAPWMWSLSLCAALYVPASAALTVAVGARFQAPLVEGLLLGVLQLVLFAIFAGVAYGLFRFLHWLARRLASSLGKLNLFGRPAPAVAVLCLLALVSSRVAMALSPMLEPLIPWRHMLASTVFLFGLWLAMAVRGSRGHILPRQPRARLATLFGIVFAAVVLVPVSLIRIGAEVHTKFVATAHSPPVATLISLVRWANDFDDDGFGSLLGENDCAAFDPAIRPGARDIPDNGIDENCDGRDFSFASLPKLEKGSDAPLPDEFRKPWNILMVTVDTVRYDHTTFGGYAKRTGRNTTPRLADLVERSVSFRFANAPSAGTMASIPAILTSKFFHSGIALGPERKGRAPEILGSNVLVSEVLKRGGYYTGAILSHYYFNDWGMDQGFDTYDNEVGRENEPYKVTSSELTDKALQWIARNHRKKWFLWVHYIDPHGRYVAHPGEESYGSDEEALYDGELHFTDKHIGRLLDELSNIPGGERTIIVVTSDHGDGFREHGFINHAVALYSELLHVPMIWFIPGVQPRTAAGAVSPLDIVPTLAAIADIDVSDLSFEGRSLVAQLFYGKDDLERIVFAETNVPAPQRAAISSQYKLIHNLKSNVYQLYDLKADPEEKRNVWQRNKAATKEMQRALSDWLERVYYARDFRANQVTQSQLGDVLLEKDPAPEHRTDISFDKGRIRLIGFDRGDAKVGKRFDLTAYFAVEGKPSGDFPVSVDLATGDAVFAHGKGVIAGDGVFPTSRWRKGDRVKVALSVRVPSPAPPTADVLVRLRGAGPDDAASAAEAERAASLGAIDIDGGTQLPTPEPEGRTAPRKGAQSPKGRPGRRERRRKSSP